MMYVDLDELPKLFRSRLFWSTNRFAVARFRRKDHLGDKRHPLSEAVRDLVETQTGTRPSGPIRLLTNFAYFGFRFNPVSFYYCFDKQGARVETIVAEVNNTPWGEQHCYVLDAQRDKPLKHLRFELEKVFHVSPYMPMDMHYDWRFSQPEDALNIHMMNFREGEKIFDATLQLRRRPITTWQLSRVLINFPLMTWKIVLAIYYQAFRLWLKKTPFHCHPEKDPKTNEAKVA